MSTPSPVSITAGDGPGQPERTPELEELYRGFEKELLVPLWTEIGDLMPTAPPADGACRTCWRWTDLLPLAAQRRELVPVGRGGERRAIALANPGLPGAPYATPTLWAAIQYLGPREDAPEHRHTQTAFRFVVEGEGVWTVVDGDPVAMRRGDLLLTPGWHFHGHHNITDAPMAWLDGLDIPLVALRPTRRSSSSARTRSTTTDDPRAVAHRAAVGPPGPAPGPRPAPRAELPAARLPLGAHRRRARAPSSSWRTRATPGVVEPGHAAVRFTNPTTGGDALPTMRTEMHRLRAGRRRPRRAATSARRSGRSSTAAAPSTRRTTTWQVGSGDLFVVPSWCRGHASAPTTGLDLFRFTDTPIFERLHRTGPSRRHAEGAAR